MLRGGIPSAVCYNDGAMSTGTRCRFLPVLLISGCLLICGRASAQLVLGQYEDEAPLGTWNILGAPSAPSAGLGGAQFAHAWDGTVSLANPALLVALPRFSVSLSASYASSSMFKYSLVNTGVVSSQGNLASGVLGLDHASFACRAGKWAAAVAVAVTESYGRPAIVVGSLGGSGYQLTLDQTGCLRVFHAGIARRLPAGLSIGAGVNLATGTLVRKVVDQTADLLRTVTITDDKRESWRGLFFNAGLAWEATERLTGALVLRAPYVKKAVARRVLRYEVPSKGTDILIEAEATNAYRQPWVVGTGWAYRVAKSWSVAADLTWFGWSRYEVTYFDEPLARSFRNVVKAGAGVEYLAPAEMYRKAARIPFRVGISYDPQPMVEPRSSYLALTFGTGLRWQSLAIDVSGSIGRESGSGDSLKSGKVVLSARYVFDGGRR